MLKLDVGDIPKRIKPGLFNKVVALDNVYHVLCLPSSRRRYTHVCWYWWHCIVGHVWWGRLVVEVHTTLLQSLPVAVEGAR